MAKELQRETGAKKTWCGPKLNEDFRKRMDDVLDVYEKPHQEAEPVVCLDELPYQLLDEVRPAVPVSPGRVSKQDDEYRRCGTCSLFVAVEPKGGKRMVQVCEHRKRADFACFVREVVRKYPEAKRIHLVLDNLNTHNPKSITDTFSAEEAQVLLARIVWHHTPVHASWFNMVEIEISVLKSQCLNRRLADISVVEREIASWQRERNQKKAKIHWRFTHRDAVRVFPALYRK